MLLTSQNPEHLLTTKLSKLHHMPLNCYHSTKVNPDFNEAMGSFDGAEICKLIGLDLLDILRM